MAEKQQSVDELCHEARQSLKQSSIRLQDAAWVAREQKNHELDKALTALAHVVDGVGLVLISLPRLKG